MTVKKILVLTSRLPYPVVGGDRLRIYAICRELSKRYEVTLLSLCESRAELEMALPADGVFAAVERVLLPKWRSRLNCLRALPGAKPLQVAYYESDAFKAKLAAMLQTHDLVFAHLIRTAHYLHDCAARKALDMTDAISLNYARVFALAKASGIKNIIYNIERTRVLDYERAVVKRFDFSLLASQVDKDFLFPPDTSDVAKVLLCTNGVDFQRIRFSYQPDGKTLVFIGNMTSLQNLDAARWFCRRVMPLLMKECGDWRLKIIGRIKQRDQAQFNRRPNVTATGYVADIHEEARGAFAGVCPVRLAAGIQNKILDYMAMGLPCIASTTGAEGLTARPNKEFLLANTPQEYTNQIKTLTQNPTTAQTLTTNARHYVETQHAWSSTLAPLLDAVDELGNSVILER